MKTGVIPEWRKIFEAEDSDFGGGAEVQQGNVENLDRLREGAAKTDGVIHLAFNHDFSQFQKSSEDDRKTVEAMGEVLGIGSGSPGSFPVYYDGRRRSGVARNPSIVAVKKSVL